MLPKQDYHRLEAMAKYGYDFTKSRFISPLTRTNAQWLLKEALPETIMRKVKQSTRQ